MEPSPVVSPLSSARALPSCCAFSEQRSARLRARTYSWFSKAEDCSATNLDGSVASWFATGARGASLPRDVFKSSILAVTNLVGQLLGNQPQK
ncbi:hypothetical protein GUJ93_ZPchr0013g34392 [Zizania palustris]|uniref:Uncharacterized protein n=1 Tax=Zizania palustris TaxID=103762 RepID=A0A8J5X4R9_ZIZPA|nr:hypothetical protein GUJ93_ZPchr0013g34392 [Zizania palustris]